MILLTLLLAALVPSAPAATDLASFRLPLPELEKLPNGLTVAWFVDDKLPVVDLALLVQTGTRNDPAGKSGTVEMTARMLERGAHGLSAAELAHRIESLGASGFASADEEGITLGMHGLSQDSGTLLDMLGWMAREPNFLPAEFAREKALLGESWRHLTDSAESVSSYVFGKTILNGTVYERGALDDVKHLAKLKIDDVRAFHRANFVPANSILLVVGRVDRKAFGERIRSLFGSWTGRLPKKPNVVARDPRFVPKKDEIFVADMPGLPQAQIRLGFRVPGIRSPRRHALAVANALLGEYFNSRLNLIVRDRIGLAYGIQSSLTYFKEDAFFSIGSATAAPNTGKLLEETIHQLRLLKAADVLAEEVATSKDYLIGGYPLSVSTLGAVATRWMNGYAFGLGPDYLNEFMPKVSAVTRESVVQAVDQAFHLDRLVVVVAGDAKQIERSLKEKGFKRLRRIPVKSLL
jgi:predicted Zn-dependent peptidase